MSARLRFRLYRWVLGRATARDFRNHEVFPLEIPGDEHIGTEPLADRLPRLSAPTDYPTTEHAGSRLRAVRLRGFLLPLIARLPARSTAPIADDLDGLLAEIYPAAYRSIWATPPATPPEFEADDMLAALAISSPFALYLRSAGRLDDPPEGVGPDEFVIDMRLFDGFSAKEGFLAPGGVAVFRIESGELVTRGILYGGEFHEPGGASFLQARALLLCAANTHLTTLLHNATMHLGYVTPFAVSCTNELGSSHPLRRLLHPALQTTLVGNTQLARFQIVGPNAFATRLFSYDYDTVLALVDEELDAFRIAHFDPAHRAERNGVNDLRVALPLWEEQLELWSIVLDYVDSYVRLYYPDDEALASDDAVTGWLADLDRLLPAGLFDDEGYLQRGEPIGRERLARVCATFLHTSSVTHDIVNNMVWNYSALSHVVPTQVPESGERQDVRVSFDLMNTLIGTWKPYNMLLDGCSQLALDDEGRQLMDDYIEALRGRQEEIDAAPSRPSRIHPRGLNPSVSN